ncbi:class II myosin [Dispira simplex]|nr:class II myosin [Dispira simplex]
MLGTITPTSMSSFTSTRQRELQRLSNSQVESEVAHANFSDKRYVWVPDTEKGYELGYIVREEQGDDVVVHLQSGQDFLVSINDVEKVNPPKFDKVEDMADLGYLNEASVVHNLKLRYYDNLIYTYSGLFLVAVNPYYNLPIYTDEVLRSYRGKKRGEAPPHIFAISDSAYQSMLQRRENQSILITGESGAGKTENTKKVIQHLTGIASDRSKTRAGAVTLEQQILRANPILESFGNAKTVRNNNSSRFGKFIRIGFNNKGYIAGANIDWYLFEKSRVTHQSPKERNYHVFYQFLKGAPAELKQTLLLDGGLNDYGYTRGSLKDIEGVDDIAEFKLLTDSFSILNFSPELQLNFFRILASVLHLGNIKVTSTRDDQAMLSDSVAAEKVCHVLGIPTAEFTKGLLRPQMKAGRDWVTQARNVQQVNYSVEALARTLYERMFGKLIERINATIDRPTGKGSFIGVLDIAGFEIFESNSFEQLCINYTNERLQQFFNHHMFVLEQEEYRREGIEWQFIDFGLDLQPTIDLIEKTKPIGILSCLDEECVMPKATDKTFTEKLHGLWRGRSPHYDAPRFKQGFIIRHYASEVEYSTDGWLDKNKDPLNENITRLLARSSESFIADLFHDFRDDTPSASTQGRSRARRGAFRTVGQRHKEQLNSLMNQLHATEPHFVRCIIPNEQKLPKVVDTPLVLEQLRCNGVLEGIRICRQGFPNRLPFAEFRQRYEILAPGAIGRGFVDSKQAAQLLLEALQMDPSQYRVGRSKVFFRAGVLPELEEIRDVKLSQIISNFQAYCRGFLAHRQFRRRLDQAKAIRIIQRNARVYIQLREWSWWKLYTQVKPLLQVTRIDEELKHKMDTIQQLEQRLTQHEEDHTQLKSAHDDLLMEKQKVEELLESERNLALDQEAILKRTQERELTLEENLREATAELERLEQQCEELRQAKEEAEVRLQELIASRDDEAIVMASMDKEREERDQRIQELRGLLDTEQDRYRSLEEDLQDKMVRLEQATEALELTETRQLELEKEALRLKSDLGTLEQRLKSEETARASLNGERTSLEDQLRQLEDQWRQSEAAREDASQQVEQLHGEVANLTDRLQTMNVDKEALDKQCRDLTLKVDTLTEQLQVEQGERDRLNQLRQRLETELNETRQLTSAKLDEETKQKQLARLREEELSNVRQELEAVQVELEESRQKQTQLTESLKTELQDVKHTNKSLVEEDRQLKATLEESKSRVGQLVATVKELEGVKTRLEAELNHRNTSLSTTSAEVVALTKARDEAQKELAMLRDQYAALDRDFGESESTRRQTEHKLATLKEELAETQRARSNVRDAHAQLEIQLIELRQRLEEMESLREGMQARFTQQSSELEEIKEQHHKELLQLKTDQEESQGKLETQYTEARTRAEELERANGTLEKAKARLVAEVEDLKHEIEREHALVRAADKATKQLETRLKETQTQVGEERKQRDQTEGEIRKLQSLLDAAQAATEEKSKQLTVLQRSKGDLEKELKGLIDEIGDGARNVHELEKTKRQLESRIETLEAQVEMERSERVKAEELKRNFEQQQTDFRQRLEAELQAKEQQTEESRRLLLKEVNLLGERLDEELAAKMELLKLKQKLEAELAELASTMDHSAKSKSDLERAKKLAESELRNLQVQLETERKAKVDLEELAKRHEKKSSGLQTQLEHLETRFETLERTRRQIEKRLDEVTIEAAAHLDSRNRLQDTVKKLKAELGAVQSQLSEASEARSTLEKAREAGNSELEYLKTRVKQDMESRLENLEESRRALMAALRLAEQESEDKQHQMASLETLRNDLQSEVDQLKERLEQEITARSESDTQYKRAVADLKDAEMKYQTEAAKALELSDSLTSYRSKLDDVMARLETAEVERHKALKNEQQIQMTMQEWQELVDKVKDDREAAEGQTRMLEEKVLHLQAKMDEDALVIANLTHVRRRLEEEVQHLTENHEKDLEEQDTTMEAMRAKYQKELEGLTTELEREKAERVTLRERTISLGEQVTELEHRLEGEIKCALAFQREKERLEDKWNQLQGGYTETRASHSAVRERAALLSEQVRDLTARLEGAQAQQDLSDKTCRHLEQRLEELEAKYGDTTKQCQHLEKSVSTYETETKQLREQLEEERDISETAISKLNKVEELLKEHQDELNRERQTNTELTKAKIQLEKQIKSLNLRLLDLETCSMADISRGSKRFTHIPANLAQQLESEAKEKNETMRTTRKMERTIRELQFQLSERDKHRSRQDEELRRMEHKIERMKAHIDDLETVENTLQLSKRRAERECEEHREYSKRLERELERIKVHFG